MDQGDEARGFQAIDDPAEDEPVHEDAACAGDVTDACRRTGPDRDIDAHVDHGAVEARGRRTRGR